MGIHIRALSIGTLAKATGVTAPTIRYYEDIGLLPTPQRSASGQRVYEDADVERLSFIRRCRDFGFAIEQVKQLAGLSISSDCDCTEVRDIASAHLAEVRARLRELNELEKSLEAFVDQCEQACCGSSGRDCVVFEALAQQDAERRR